MSKKRCAPCRWSDGNAAAITIEVVRRRVVALLPRDERGLLPLCYTIEDQVRNGLSDLDPALIRVVLREVTLTSDYLSRIVTDEWRYALNGEPIERIRKYQREFASGLLAVRADSEGNDPGQE